MTVNKQIILNNSNGITGPPYNKDAEERKLKSVIAWNVAPIKNKDKLAERFP